MYGLEIAADAMLSPRLHKSHIEAKANKKLNVELAKPRKGMSRRIQL